jgi:SCY1-like protein 2
VFVFDKRSVEKLHKPRRREQMSELLKLGLGHLQCYRHPKLLQVLHGPDESPDAIAFAAEPVLGSLANILR